MNWMYIGWEIGYFMVEFLWWKLVILWKSYEKFYGVWSCVVIGKMVNVEQMHVSVILRGLVTPILGDIEIAMTMWPWRGRYDNCPLILVYIVWLVYWLNVITYYCSYYYSCTTTTVLVLLLLYLYYYLLLRLIVQSGISA